jgi:hypothetical protein
MKVKELIDKLSEYDPEMMVVTSGYEGGLNELMQVSTVRLNLNVNSAWYYGNHEADAEGDSYAVQVSGWRDDM